MKNRSLILSLVAVVLTGLFGFNANAQETFHKGNQIASLTVGIFNNMENVRVPAITATYEYCVLDNMINGKNGSLGLGATAGYFATGAKTAVGSTWANGGIVGGRASFHYQFARNLDTYAGLLLGAKMVTNTVTATAGDASVKVPSSDTSVTTTFGWGLYLGGRYYFTPNFGVNLEAGYGFSVLNLGVTYRF